MSISLENASKVSQFSNSQTKVSTVTAIEAPASLDDIYSEVETGSSIEVGAKTTHKQPVILRSDKILKANDPLATVTSSTPCKICGCKKKCAASASGNNLLCGNSTALVGDIINGYKCNSTFNPKSHCSHSFVRVDQSSQATVKQSPKPTKPEMSREDRDLWNRKIISTLKLTESDRTHLKDIRGLTDQQIDNWGYRSVGTNHKLVGDDWPENLPGYRHDKKQLAISEAGILTPIKQLNQIVAFKVRLTVKKGDQRYTCVSDKKYTSYHIDGEQPLAVLINDNNDFSQGTWVTEGNELKPVIVHEKYNSPVLGGARYWHTSKNHAAKFLPLVKEKSETINLAVDAGDVLNNNGIPLKWVKEYKYFESQGFKPRFGLWGQITKESPDIDELPDLSSVEFINLDQFKELVKEHNPDAYQKIIDWENEADQPLLNDVVDINTKKPKKQPPTTNEGLHCNDITPELAIFENTFQDGTWLGLNDSYYRYKDSYWQRQENESVLSLIANKLKKCFIWVKDGEDFKQRKPYFTDSKKKSTFGICLSSLYETYQNFKEQFNLAGDNHRYYRCFNNGVVDMRTGELLPHDKKYLLTSKIDAGYKPGSDCPEVFKNFILNSYGEKYIDIFRALISLYVDPTAPYGYFTYFIGASGSGKGTAIRFLGKLFDRIASLTSFSELMTPEGRHQNLSGVNFASFSDMSSGYHANLEAFYELVDNGSLNGRPLYSKDGYPKQWDCRFAVASVHPIRVENSQGGWARRALIIPSKPLDPTLKDNQLEKKLEAVKGEVIGWALGLKGEERDHILSDYINKDADLKAIRREHEIDADSIKGFIDRCLRPTNSTKVKSVDEIYKFYEAYCKAAGYKNLNLDNFKNRIKTAINDFYVPRKQKRDNGKVIWTHAHFINVDVIGDGFIKQEYNQIASYFCNLDKCSEGGLEFFEAFAKELTASKQTSVTTLSRTCHHPSVRGVVTAETVSMQDFQEVSPPSPSSPPKSLISVQILESKENGTESVPYDQSHSLYKEISPGDAGDAGDGAENLDGVKVVAVTGANFEGGYTPVTITDGGDSTNVLTAEPQTTNPIKTQLGDFKIGDRIQLDPRCVPNYHLKSDCIAVVTMVSYLSST